MYLYMRKQEAFQIVKNYRKTRVIKHRNKKYVPPISIETRRMSKRKNLIPNDLQDIFQHISLFEKDFTQDLAIIMRDLTSQDPLKGEYGKQVGIQETPFGQYNASGENLQCFLNIHQF